MGQGGEGWGGEGWWGGGVGKGNASCACNGSDLLGIHVVPLLRLRCQGLRQLECLRVGRGRLVLARLGQQGEQSLNRGDRLISLGTRAQNKVGRERVVRQLAP